MGPDRIWNEAYQLFICFLSFKEFIVRPNTNINLNYAEVQGLHSLVSEAYRLTINY